MKYLCTLFSLLTLLPLYGQSLSGRAVFATESAATVTFDSASGMSAQEVAAINASMQRAMAREYVLTFNASESLYRELPKLADPQAENEMNVIGVGHGMDGGLYKHTHQNKLIETRDAFGKLFLIKDSLTKPDWTITEEEKEIHGLRCLKATFTNEQGGTVTAWFSPEIPVNQGPGEYWGLPGFILSVSNSRLNIDCTEIDIDTQATAQIDPPRKGKVVSMAKFREIYAEKVQALQRMSDEDDSKR